MRTDKLQIRYTDDERKAWEAAASETGQSLSAWMRSACNAQVKKVEALEEKSRVKPKSVAASFRGIPPSGQPNTSAPSPFARIFAGLPTSNAVDLTKPQT